MSFARSAAAAVILGVLAGGAPGAEPRTLTVSVAISLRPAVTEAARLYEVEHPEARIRINAAGSAVLAQQARRGAPVDLLISASPRELDRLAPSVALGPRRAVASNRIVLVVPRGAAPPARIEDLADPSFDLVAVGNPRTAPLGRYSEEILRSAGLFDRLKPRLVLAENAHQVLRYVVRGEVAAGLVYRTDAAWAGDGIAKGPEARADLHGPIVYEAAVLERSSEALAAEGFLEFLTSSTGRRLLERFGFLAPS